MGWRILYLTAFTHANYGGLNERLSEYSPVELLLTIAKGFGRLVRPHLKLLGGVLQKYGRMISLSSCVACPRGVQTSGNAFKKTKKNLVQSHSRRSFVLLLQIVLILLFVNEKCQNGVA